MNKTETYRQTLRSLDDWVPFVKKNSGLPGPRGNLELAYAVADIGTQEQFEHFLTIDGFENTPEVFVLFCGVVGLGKLAVEKPELFERLRMYASDPRWRIREAVPTGLQLSGDQNMDLLLGEMKKWSKGKGNWYEKRAAATTLAEPRLLEQERHAMQVLQVLEKITTSMETAEPKGEAYMVLRKGMGYCWSVAVAALPAAGKRMMEKWMDSKDEDVRWVMRENLKKNRLLKMDAEWVNKCLQKLR